MIGNPTATEQDLQQAIKSAHLEDFISTLKDGLDTYIGERGVMLSGGQKQRVAIARAFLKQAKKRSIAAIVPGTVRVYSCLRELPSQMFVARGIDFDTR